MTENEIVILGGLLGIIGAVIAQFGISYLLMEAEYRRKACQDRRDWEESHGWTPGGLPAWRRKFEPHEQGLERMMRVKK